MDASALSPGAHSTNRPSTGDSSTGSPRALSDNEAAMAIEYGTHYVFRAYFTYHDLPSCLPFRVLTA